MKQGTPTLIGHVDSVKGGIVTIRLRDDVPTFMMVDGRSYRMGQVGAFLRIPLGYTQLYAVCTLVGAAAAPQIVESDSPPGHRWLSATLFGESIGGVFERGVSQYPTIEDEVHLVSPQDMRVIYGSTKEERSITVGHIAAASGISGKLDLGKLVTRHSAVVGSTGSGKSNFLAVLLEAIATQGFPAARVLVIDPHGEYGSAVGEYGRVFRIKPDKSKGEMPLYVPFWALPFDELQAIALGQMQPGAETAVRDEVTAGKKAAIEYLADKPPDAAITADSPIPFSLKKLWFDLDDFERQTFQDNARTQLSEKTQVGDSENLVPNLYPAPSPGSQAPFTHPRPRNIDKNCTCSSCVSSSYPIASILEESTKINSGIIRPLFCHVGLVSPIAKGGLILVTVGSLFAPRLWHLRIVTARTFTCFKKLNPRWNWHGLTKNYSLTSTQCR